MHVRRDIMRHLFVITNRDRLNIAFEDKNEVFLQVS